MCYGKGCHGLELLQGFNILQFPYFLLTLCSQVMGQFGSISCYDLECFCFTLLKKHKLMFRQLYFLRSTSASSVVKHMMPGDAFVISGCFQALGVGQAGGGWSLELNFPRNLGLGAFELHS